MEDDGAAGPKFPPLKHYRLTQQKLPSWRPLLPWKGAILLFAIGGCVLLLLGLVFFFVARGQFEAHVRYDEVCDLNSQCDVEVSIPRRVSGRVELRYELDGFFQNHRRFGLSRIDSQLMGQFVDFAGMANAVPYRSEGDSENMSDWILPCGLFAYSVFNDSFSVDGFSETGLTFSAERERLFQPLSREYTSGNKWLDESTIFTGGMQDEHFIVWMRTSFLPRVVKSYSVCDDCSLEPGSLKIRIDSRYPTSGFGGSKSVVVSSVNGLGSKNEFLGIAYMSCGAVCAAYSLFLLIVFLVYPRELGQSRN